MSDIIDRYIAEINSLYSTDIAGEHAYRPALQNLIKELLPQGYTVVNEPARDDCGAPDFIILKGDTPLAYIETKDINDSDLDGRKKNKEQFDRYRSSLDHIVFTDYLDFHLYENGEYVDAVRIADVREKTIVSSQETIAKFEQLIAHLSASKPQRITSPDKLARVMAGKARLLANVIEKALEKDKESKTELSNQMKAFQEHLIHDLNEKTFADIYAQTIVYGLFSARLNDKTPDNFSRIEANTLIPKTNPFLRKVFNDIAGFNVDGRIAWIVDDLVEAFRVTDMEKVMKDFKQSTRQTDPLMHFYEDFLGQYDPRLKKSRGVYYTPQPVVDFIVRAVDDILKTDFGLPLGLADSSKIEHEVVNDQYVKAKKGQKANAKTLHKTVHRVQILDPATGTGTFLAAVIRQIYANMEGLRGVWNSYVDEHLLPRLYGFELMMASYTIAHLKLNMVLNETGYTPQSDQRLNVYLTNSLEEYNADTGTIFSYAISEESNAASRIKRDSHVMVMIGNPPYSISSSNNSVYITELLKSYKKDLNERNIQPLSGDYIKFIRLGQEYINRSGEGVLAFICNNSFLDGIIHRQMRKELMKYFCKIYIFNLHGDSRKEETTEDGSKDENVFDIMQGVSINIFYQKRDSDPETCRIYYSDLYGSREDKYNHLINHGINDVQWVELKPQQPYYFFSPKDFSLKEEYERGFKVNELMQKYISGVKTSNDAELVDFEAFHNKNNHRYYFRPFDIRYIDYDIKKVARHRYNIMHHMLRSNVALLACKQALTEKYGFFVSKGVTDINYSGTAGKFGAGLVFPLWLYSEDGTIRKPNFNSEILQKIEESVGEPLEPQELFDYIYAVLHSEAYRAKYKEFLKIDFPRIPYPEDKEEYRRLATLGGQLRRLHLMEEVPSSDYAKFDREGNGMVDRVDYMDGNVWINKEQCFSNVPKVAWNFYIGGYQPAQKWLKDRKGRTLGYDDILHYQTIVTILFETERIMAEIDSL